MTKMVKIQIKQPDSCC